MRELGETDKFIIRLAFFNTPLSTTDRLSRQKIIKDAEDLNTVHTFDQNNMCGTLHTTITELTLFSNIKCIY